MSYEANITTAQNQIQKQSTAKELSSNIMFSGVMTGGFGAIPAIKRNKGIKNALNVTKANNHLLNEYAAKQGCDTFTKKLKTAYNYEQYTSLAKTAQKLEKKAKKAEKLIQNKKLPLFENIKNIFRKQKVTVDDFKNIVEDTTNIKSKEAFDNLAKAKNALKNGDDIADAAKAIANNKGMMQNAKTLFKHELSNKFVIFITAASALPRITNEIIPAFQNEGIVAGIKTTAKVTARTVADFFSNAGFSAIGRAIGTVAGSIFGPVGTVIGGTIGDITGSFFSNKLMCKIFKKDDSQNEQNDAQSAQSTQTAPEENIQPSTSQNQSNPQNDSSAKASAKADIYKPNRYEGMTSRYQGPRKTRKEFLA